MSIRAGQLALKNIATSVASRVNSTLNTYGVFDFTLLIQILPIFFQLIQSCKKPAPTPTPVPPDVTAAAWEKAWKSRNLADAAWVGGKSKYKTAAVNRLAKDAMRQHKRDGDPITKAEARELAIACLEEARTGDVHTMALAIDELES